MRDVISEGGLGQEIARPSPVREPDHAKVDGSPGAAQIVGERIRHSVELETFGSDCTLPVITVSVGVAGLHAALGTADGLVEEADRALYRAKQSGKNQVAIAAAPD